jgi:hypothetical protein
MADQGTPNRALAEIKESIEAGRPLLYIQSPEESRVDQLLTDAGKAFFNKAVPLYTWTATEGLHGADGASLGKETTDPRHVLDWIIAHKEPALFDLRDFHEPMRQSAEVRRRIRDLCTACFDTGKFTFISSPVAYIPDELQRDIVLIELPLPDFQELQSFIARERDTLAAAGVTVDKDPGTLIQLGRAVQGLTLNETRHALRRALAVTKKLDAGALPFLLEEKHLLIKKKTGVIEYVTAPGGLENVGGAPLLKKWLLERRTLFEMRDQISHDIVPKGLLMMGISGCGKSLAVKAVAQVFQLPLYRIDMIEVFSGRHGNPEGTFVSACRTLEEMAPAVLWFDEIEMASRPRTKTPCRRTHLRLLPDLMQETRGLFVAATANRIDLLPAEMIRRAASTKSSSSISNEEERLDICRIQKRGIARTARHRTAQAVHARLDGRGAVGGLVLTTPARERELTGDDLPTAQARSAAVQDDEGTGRAHPFLGPRPRRPHCAAHRRAQ